MAHGGTPVTPHNLRSCCSEDEDDALVSEFLRCLLPLLRPEGCCHWYDFVADWEFPACERSVARIAQACEAVGLSCKASGDEPSRTSTPDHRRERLGGGGQGMRAAAGTPQLAWSDSALCLGGDAREEGASSALGVPSRTEEIECNHCKGTEQYGVVQESTCRHRCHLDSVSSDTGSIVAAMRLRSARSA